MLDAIKSLFCPSADFFGPKADTVRCPVYREVPECPLITNCMDGVKRAWAIHEIAKLRAASTSWPEWQRWNGSIIFEKLPEAIKSKFNSRDELLDSEGYIKLETMHVVGREGLEGHSNAAIGELPGSGGTNSCPCHQGERHFMNREMSELAYSPALALRLKVGATFDPRDYKDFFLKEAPTPIQLGKYEKVGDKLEKREDLRALWEQIEKIQAVASQALKKVVFASSIGAIVVIGALASRKVPFHRLLNVRI